jgi:acetylornithine deacetylase
MAIIQDPEGDQSNRLVKIGPREAGGYFLSRHMDVVPTSAPEWSGALSCQRITEDLGSRFAA